MIPIGAWRFDPEAGVLQRAGAERSLEDRAARVLAILCRRRGEVVAKDDLLGEVWQGRSVSTNSVAFVIGDLRRALDDDPADPVLITTIGKRGYRLAPVPAVDPAPQPRRRYAVFGLALGAVCALAALAAVATHRPRPIDLVVMPTRNETGEARFDALSRSLSSVVMDGAVRLHGVEASPAVTPASNSGHRVVLQSRLILWNGAPELAITATGAPRGVVLWSTFATGRSGNLARDAAAKLRALDGRIDAARRAGTLL